MSKQLSPQAQNRGVTLSRSVEIRIESLYKSFGSHHVLDGINLEVHRGEMIAIVGGSGSGKTTLLRHIIGLRSEERHVGKECRSGWSQYHKKKRRDTEE